MAKKLAVRKYNGSLHPATQHDHEIFETLKLNQPYEVVITQWSQRSLQHHGLYWSGLVGLISQYWQPEGGVIIPQEKKTLVSLAKFAKSVTGDSSAVEKLCKYYLTELKKKRMATLEIGEPDKQAIHMWLKEEAGYFDYVKTPGGLQKRLRSINFNAMSKEQFETFYKRVSNVAWNFFSNKNLFQSEDEMNNAINNLMAMTN